MIGVSRANHDYYVRIPAGEIHRIGLEHHSTETSCAMARSGFTEWIARCDSALVVVSWDWTRLDDGSIVHPHPRIVLSNLMLLNDHAFDQGIDRTEAELLLLLDRIDWKSAVSSTCERVMRGLSGYAELGWPRV
jgi:hypothetical protein